MQAVGGEGRLRPSKRGGARRGRSGSNTKTLWQQPSAVCDGHRALAVARRKLSDVICSRNVLRTHRSAMQRHQPWSPDEM